MNPHENSVFEEEDEKEKRIQNKISEIQKRNNYTPPLSGLQYTDEDRAQAEIEVLEEDNILNTGPSTPDDGGYNLGHWGKRAMEEARRPGQAFRERQKEPAFKYDMTSGWHPGAKILFDHVYKPNANAIKSTINSLGPNQLRSFNQGYNDSHYYGRMAANIDQQAYVTPYYPQAVDIYNQADGQPIPRSRRDGPEHELARRWQTIGQTPEQYKALSDQQAQAEANRIYHDQMRAQKRWYIPEQERGGITNALFRSAGNFVGSIPEALESHYLGRYPWMNKQHVENTRHYMNKGYTLPEAADMSRFDYLTDFTNYDHLLPSGFVLNLLKPAAKLARKSDNFNDLYAPGLPSAARLGIRANNSPVTNFANNSAQRMNNAFTNSGSLLNPSAKRKLVQQGKNFLSTGTDSILDQNALQLGTNSRSLLIGHDAPFLHNMGLDQDILRSAGLDATADVSTRIFLEQLERDMAKQMRFRFHKWGGTS